MPGAKVVRIPGVAAAAASDDGPFVFSGVTGTNTITGTSNGPALAAAQTFILVPANTNSGAVTLNGIAVKKADGTALAAGDLVANKTHFLEYDGTVFRLLTGGLLSNSDIPGGIDAAKVADGSVSNAEFQRLDGVTSGIQAQLDAKLPLSLVGWHIYKSSDTTVATGTFVDIPFESEYFDPSGLHSTSSNTERITHTPEAKVPVFCQVCWSAPAGTTAQFWICVNGTRTYPATDYATSANQFYNTLIGGLVDLADLQYVSLQMRHNGGSNAFVYGSGTGAQYASRAFGWRAGK